MVWSKYRVLRRRGPVSLVELANPVNGVGFAVNVGGLGIWRGDDLIEAENQFEQATKTIA